MYTILNSKRLSYGIVPTVWYFVFHFITQVEYESCMVFCVDYFTFRNEISWRLFCFLFHMVNEKKTTMLVFIIYRYLTSNTNSTILTIIYFKSILKLRGVKFSICRERTFIVCQTVHRPHFARIVHVSLFGILFQFKVFFFIKVSAKNKL